eukprot:2751972-Pyramimonas_sp.AAC.1
MSTLMRGNPPATSGMTIHDQARPPFYSANEVASPRGRKTPGLDLRDRRQWRPLPKPLPSRARRGNPRSPNLILAPTLTFHQTGEVATWVAPTRLCISPLKSSRRSGHS